MNIDTLYELVATTRGSDDLYNKFIQVPHSGNLNAVLDLTCSDDDLLPVTRIVIDKIGLTQYMAQYIPDALQIACGNGAELTVNYLIIQYSSYYINIIDVIQLALQTACSHRQFKIIKILISYIRPNSVVSRTMYQIFLNTLNSENYEAAAIFVCSSSVFGSAITVGHHIKKILWYEGITRDHFPRHNVAKQVFESLDRCAHKQTTIVTEYVPRVLAQIVVAYITV